MLLAAACAAAGCSATPPPSAGPSTSPHAVTPGVSPQIVFGDGTLRVPDQVAPGTYRTLRPVDECYWTRLGGFTGGLGDLIASRISAGYEVATIYESDAGFDSVGCGGWTDQLLQVTATKGQFGEGTYVVGVDMDPGTYVATGGESCEWARLSGFGATESEVIERGFADPAGPPRVTVTSTDAGFTSGGCGGWRLER